MIYIRYVRFTLKIIGFIASILLLLLIINYVRLNTTYILNQDMYNQALDVHGNNNNYVPQGLAYSSEYDVVLQTSYNAKHTVSMLYITDFKSGKLLKSLKLKELNDSDNINHVGGIATYKDTVWITNNYEVNEYDLKSILSTNDDFIKSRKNTKLTIRGDFCAFNDGKLYIGDFFLRPFYMVPDNNPLMYVYNYDEDINYNLPKFIISLPKMVQGLAITDDNKYIFTESFTNLINSKLEVYDDIFKNKKDTYNLNGKEIPYYKFSKDNLINTIKLPPMAEGIFYKEDNLYILFENSSDHYFFAFPKIKNIISLNKKYYSER